MKFRLINFLVTTVLSLIGFANIASAKIIIVVSVDWEGEILAQENIEAIKEFREQFPEVTMQHFLNPAYYTEGQEDPAHVTRKINSVLKDGDEQGMHIHSWRQLVESSGIKFKASPNFIDDTGDRRGVLVPLWAYSAPELKKIFKNGIDILVSHGFERPKSFRSGGWQGSAEVIEALYDNGFTIDASAVPIAHLDYWEQDNLGSWVKQLWKNISIMSQPYLIESANAKLIELPNNGCLSDYVSGEGMLADFKLLSKNTADNSEQDIYYSIGFHQETAARYLYRLKDALTLIKQDAAKNNIEYTFAKFPLQTIVAGRNSLEVKAAVPASALR